MPSREQVAEVVSAHLWHHTKHTHCVCGWRSSLAQLAVGGYTAHVADALMPLFEQARNEALEPFRALADELIQDEAAAYADAPGPYGQGRGNALADAAYAIRQLAGGSSG